MPAILPDMPTVETVILDLTNAYRKEHQLQDVRPDAQLAKVARAYAGYLAQTGTFSHTADGRQAGDRVTAVGYQWCQVAENLSMHEDSRGFESRDLAEKMVKGWIGSPGHRQNMLSPGATQIGVGVAQAPGPYPKYVSVQVFARPKSLEYEFKVSNSTDVAVSYSFGGETHEARPHFIITHSSCMPSELRFTGAGGVPLSVSYEAMNGLVYKLVPDASFVGGVRIEVGPVFE